MIDEKEVTAYVTIPDCFLQGCSEDIVIFRADGGNHFTDYGIYKGMFLFFDRKKRFKKGRLSCYINTAGDDRPKNRVSDKNIDGYKHLGVNVKVIQDTLGHKDISTTLNIYTDVTKELRKSEFEGLDSYFKNEYNKVSV